MLGVFANQKFESAVVELSSGDRLVLFTDGVTEARDCNEDEFGDERLLAALRATQLGSAAEIQRKVLQSASEFSQGIWHDDATVVVVAVQ